MVPCRYKKPALHPAIFAIPALASTLESDFLGLPLAPGTFEILQTSAPLHALICKTIVSGTVLRKGAMFLFPTPIGMLPQLLTGIAAARERLTDSGGEIVIRRLNRHEYDHTMKALFGVSIPTDSIPHSDGKLPSLFA